MTKHTHESTKEHDRRSRVEAPERQSDLAEQYERDLSAVTSPDDRARIAAAFEAQRTSFRETEINAGRRSPGMCVMMHQIMWARWLEVAVEQECKALDAFGRMLRGEPALITDEFRASLLAVTASAYTIDALFGDIKYLIPAQQRRDKRHQMLRDAFQLAFGISESAVEGLATELLWLFECRDNAAHPYTEAELPKHHPAGFNIGAEHADFNALTSGRAVDVAMSVLQAAATPPNAHNRWIERWSTSRAAYMNNVVRPLRSKSDAARQLVRSSPVDG